MRYTDAPQVLSDAGISVRSTMSARRKRRQERKRRYQSATLPASSASSPDRFRETDKAERIAYSRRQAAEALGVSVSTIDRRVVPAVDTVKTPWGQRLIPVGELQRFVRENIQPGKWPAGSRPAGRPPSLPDSVVARIRLEYARGRSLGEIAKALTGDRVPTAHSGRQWWPSTVRSILRRAAVADPRPEPRRP